MSRLSKTSVSIVVISTACMGLFLLSSDSGWTREAKKAPRVRELQQKRLAVLEQAYEVVTKGAVSALVSSETVHTAKVALLVARRDYAETREDRIKACQEAVEEANQWQKIIQHWKDAGRITPIAELNAQAFLLEMEIELENALADQ